MDDHGNGIPPRWRNFQESPLTDVDVAARLTDMIADAREMAARCISPGTEQALMACADTLARLTVLVMVRGRSVSIGELREMATRVRESRTSGHSGRTGKTGESVEQRSDPSASGTPGPEAGPSSG